jgi:hypothetical protein
MSDDSNDAGDELPPADVSRDSYDQLQRLNWSRLRLLERSPAHYRNGYGDDTASLKLGTAVHMAILEPARFEAEYVVTDIRRDKRTKAWTEFETAQTRAGKSILIRSEYNKTLAIRDAVRGNKRAADLLQGGKPEVTLQWEFEGEGFRFECKGRADYIGGAIVDLKSTQCSSPRAFSNSCAKYGYFGQAAWYSDGLFLATGERRPFYIVAVESAPPHIVTVFRMTDELLAHGREQYQTLLGKLDYCQTHDWWGGYTEAEETDLELPQYMRGNTDE